jgi:hypothetical protein
VAGPFSFRLWIDDATPPRVRLLTPAAKSALLLAVADSGSGIDPRSIVCQIDGRRRVFTLSPGRLRIPLDGVGKGTHRLTLSIADFQETKNSESVVGVLPNTTLFRATFRKS